MGPISAIVGGGSNKLCEGVDWDTYRSIQAMNPSTLVHGLRSMKHLLHAWEHGRKDTDDFRWGRAVHCLLFEPSSFESRYAIWDGRRRYGHDWDDFCADHIGQEILTEEQLAKALDASHAFVGEPKVQEIIKAGKFEVTLLVEEFGMQCKGRIDWIASGRSIVDLKTTKNISAREFGYDFFKYRYDVKLGLYQRWLDKLTGLHWPVELICLEKEPPWDITVFPIADAVLTRGAEKGLAVLADLRTALDTDTWPGIAKGTEYFLEVPYREMVEEEVEYDV